MAGELSGLQRAISMGSMARGIKIITGRENSGGLRPRPTFCYFSEVIEVNICKALSILELNGGHIFRSETDKVTIFWGKFDSWDDFEKCRATLNIGDLTAIDWKHSRKEK
jgi:hypothetical protein